MQMERYEQVQQQQHTSRGQAELEVFNMVGELLSITFEKYDVEVVIESDRFLHESKNYDEILPVMQMQIDFEEIIETKNSLEITLSGDVLGQNSYEESFMLFFSLAYDAKINVPWNPGNGKSHGLNYLRLQIAQKPEQISDPVFRVTWISQDPFGKKENHGKGQGILVFSKNTMVKVN